MPCCQNGCLQPAPWRYNWPGRGELGICDAHLPWLRALARALDLPVSIRRTLYWIPIDETQ